MQSSRRGLHRESQDILELLLFLVLDRSNDGLVGRPLYTCEERAATSLSFIQTARLQNRINRRRPCRRPLTGSITEPIPRQRPSGERGIEGEPDGGRPRRRGRIDRPRGHLRHAADCLDCRPKTAVFRHEPGRRIAAGRETRARCVNRLLPTLRGGAVGQRQNAQQNQKRRPSRAEIRSRTEIRKSRRQPIHRAASRRSFIVEGRTQNHAILPMRLYTGQAHISCNSYHDGRVWHSSLWPDGAGTARAAVNHPGAREDVSRF